MIQYIPNKSDSQKIGYNEPELQIDSQRSKVDIHGMG